MKKIILASKSPRRKQILSNLGYDFTILESDFIETSEQSLPEQVAKEFAVGKATAVFNASVDKDVIVIGADTVVSIDGEILGKPKDEQHAKEMLKKLSNRTHEVITGYSVQTQNKKIDGFIKTLVTFNELTDSEIDEYVSKFSPLDKAGAYGIQDGYPLVKKYDGSYYNIVGLPAEKIDEILKTLITD